MDVDLSACLVDDDLLKQGAQRASLVDRRHQPPHGAEIREGARDPFKLALARGEIG